MPKHLMAVDKGVSLSTVNSQRPPSGPDAVQFTLGCATWVPTWNVTAENLPRQKNCDALTRTATMHDENNNMSAGTLYS